MNQINKFFLNGQQYYTEQSINLSDLISYFNYNDCLLVLEHNHLICDKTKWKKTFVQDLDKIEIVTIVGGG